METISPTKSNTMLDYNCACEELGCSKRLKGIEEINEKNLTYIKSIHEDEKMNW